MKFSVTEKEHLLKAWIAISLAFAILFTGMFDSFTLVFIISLLTVGLGFLLHEIAHKMVAQKYGCWAEFRADDKMLLIAIFSAFLGFIFAAPGAVVIQGHVTKEKNGKISVAGPLTNIVLSLLFLGIFYLPLDTLVQNAADLGYRINALLAAFNMIPALNFDGQKILKWNKVIYASVTFVAVLLFVSSFLF